MRVTLLISLLFVIYCLFLPVIAFAACDPKIPGDCPAGLNQIEDVFGRIISYAVYLAFIALFIMILTAGIKYLTSGGDQKSIQSAHQAVTWAILGILFLAIAWITLLLIQAFTGIKVTQFNIRALPF